MKVKIKWHKSLLPALALLSFLAAGTVLPQNVYAEPEWSYTYLEFDDSGKSETTDPEDPPYQGADAYANATIDEENRQFGCWTWTDTEAYGIGSTSASASATGWYKIFWVWDGPPGTAPGGDLEWSFDSDGYVYVEGRAESNTESTNSKCSASAKSDGTCNSDGSTGSVGRLEVRGYTDCYEAGGMQDAYVNQCVGIPSDDFSTNPDPPDGYATHYYGRTSGTNKYYGYFEIRASWTMSTDEEVTIAAETAIVEVIGYAQCDVSSLTEISYPGDSAESEADADTDGAITSISFP